MFATARFALPLALTLSAAAAFAQPADSSELVLRVYDARDLAAALPAPTRAGARHGTLSIVPRITPSGENGSEVRLGIALEGGAEGTTAAAGPVSAVDLVVTRLCDQLSLSREELVEGVYVISGAAAQHERFVKLLQDVRSLYEGAYEFELYSYPAAAAQAPGVGAPAELQTVTLRTRQVIARRVESRIAITEEITYVRDWVPIVGHQSVGYDSDTGTVTKGVRIAVTAAGADPVNAPAHAAARGPDGSAGAPVSLRIRGEWCDAIIEKQPSPLGPLSGGTLELGLPRIVTRTIESDLRVTLGQPTVLAVVPGTKPGEVVVIAGTLRELR